MDYSSDRDKFKNNRDARSNEKLSQKEYCHISSTFNMIIKWAYNKNEKTCRDKPTVAWDESMEMKSLFQKYESVNKTWGLLRQLNIIGHIVE